MNILFICTGNTCRSPMAEGYLKSLQKSCLSVRSRGLAAYSEPAATNAIAVMAELEIDITDHISKTVTPEDINWADRIICMSNLHAEALSCVCKEKLSVLGKGIHDPFGGSLEVYRNCRDMIIYEIDKLFLPFAVKSAEREHITQIAKLESICFSSPWTEQVIIDSIAHGTKFFVAEKDGRVLGYIGINCVADEGYIANIAVFPQHRRKGVATALLKRIISLAKASKLCFVSLEVRASNFEAITLYEKLGFEQEGRRPDFYTNPKEDALIMTLRKGMTNEDFSN